MEVCFYSLAKEGDLKPGKIFLQERFEIFQAVGQEEDGTGVQLLQLKQ